MACIIMPVIAFNNINAMENNIEKKDNYQINDNSNIESILGSGVEVQVSQDEINSFGDGDFVAYFGDTSKSHGTIEVNLWGDTNNNKVSIENFL